MGKNNESNQNDKTVKCPKCRKPMKFRYDHWVDPLVECQTPTCHNAKMMCRVSKLKQRGSNGK